MFNNVFPNIVPFIRQCQKCDGATEETDDKTIWCISVACWISKATRARAIAHALGHPHTHMHTHAFTRARTHAPTEICNIYCFSTAIMVSSKRLNMTSYVIASFVNLWTGPGSRFEFSSQFLVAVFRYDI